MGLAGWIRNKLIIRLNGSKERPFLRGLSVVSCRGVWRGGGTLGPDCDTHLYLFIETKTGMESRYRPATMVDIITNEVSCLTADDKRSPLRPKTSYFERPSQLNDDFDVKMFRFYKEYVERFEFLALQRGCLLIFHCWGFSLSFLILQC